MSHDVTLYTIIYIAATAGAYTAAAVATAPRVRAAPPTPAPL